LRTALSLSCLTGKPFRIVNIRKGRKKPGLAPQHLLSVRAASEISGAQVSGDRQGSVELVFSPGKVKEGDFSFDVGTAGSTLLVLQSIVPALLFTRGKSTVSVRGGTHVPFSPPFHYAASVLVPALGRLGAKLSLSIGLYGFYPKGGGAIRSEIFSSEEIRPLGLPERGKIHAVKGWSAAGNLPLSIARRQRDAAMEALRSRLRGADFPVDIEVHPVQTPGQGTFLFLLVESESGVAGFSSLGGRGKRAEAVGEEAAEALAAYCETGAALDPHLPDQLALYLAMCREGSSFTTSRVTEHLVTNLWTIGLFREFRFSVEGEVGKPGTVRIGPDDSVA
ncbi:MAG: RNA 3'-phosphate cyclase, partial [Deltaproteobacteria bacterium]|nr:RNA 3'-phosphate cyclase [Deltaproteobacteria bacterium]